MTFSNAGETTTLYTDILSKHEHENIHYITVMTHQCLYRSEALSFPAPQPKTYHPMVIRAVLTIKGLPARSIH